MKIVNELLTKQKNKYIKLFTLSNTFKHDIYIKYTNSNMLILENQYSLNKEIFDYKQTKIKLENKELDIDFKMPDNITISKNITNMNKQK